MKKLTALEIKQQQFEKSLRGYDVSEVQAYLGLISSEWERMVSSIRHLETQIDKMNDKLQHYERVEEALHETLQTAKDNAEQRLTGARKEAKSIVEKAEIEADSIVREASQQRQQIRQSILRLLDRREEIISGIKSYLDIAQESLNHFSKDEASLFSLPKEQSDIPQNISSDNESDSETANNPRDRSSKFELDEDSLAGKAQNLDDILDELD